MTRETFPDQYTPGVGYLVDGDLLNKMAGVSNARTNAIPHYARGSMGVASTASPPPATVHGIAVIISASNTCADSPLPSDGKEAPCATVNKYLCRFRWFEHSTQIWQEYDEELMLDASVYWEGVMAGAGGTPGLVVPPVVGGVCQRSTDASKGPTSGPGFGQIPSFLAGDMVPAIYDPQRGWVVPLCGPYQDVPSGEFHSQAIQTFTPHQFRGADWNFVDAYLEVLPPGGAWTARQRIAWRVPLDDEGDWWDSRSCFVTFYAPATLSTGTRVRLRVSNFAAYDVCSVESTIRFWGASRFSSAAAHNGLTIIDLSGGTIMGGYAVNGSCPGRFKDSPIFTHLGAGVFEITYLDPCDAWIIGCEFQLTIGNCGLSSSSTISSSASSASTAAQSSSSSSSKTISTSSSSQTVSTSSVTISTSSLTVSTSSQTVSTSSLTVSTSSQTITTSSGNDFCCVNVVTDVICNADATVDEICYTTICYPKIPGVTCGDHKGSENCAPCGLGSSLFGSSPPSLGDQTIVSLPPP